MKRVVLIILTFVLVFTTSITAFSAESSNSTSPVQCVLSGFSYNPEGNGMDPTNDYSVSIEYCMIDEKLMSIDISSVEGILGPEENLIMQRTEYGGYTTEKNNVIYVFELVEGTPILDIITENRVYAFGGDRRAKIASHLSFLRSQAIKDLKNTQIQMPEYEVNYAGGKLKGVANSTIHLNIFWNPKLDKKLSLRINTLGTKNVTYVQRVRIMNASVPSTFTVMTCNPHEPYGGSDFDLALSYFWDSLTYWISLPSFPTAPSGTTSGWSGNTFWFDFGGVNVLWNKLKGNSTTSSNGILAQVFLNKNPASIAPIPTGTVKIMYREPGTASYTTSLSF